jgi:hypothetical protein
MAIGQQGQQRHWDQGTAHEQHEKPAPELAPKRCGRESHIMPGRGLSTEQR